MWLLLVRWAFNQAGLSLCGMASRDNIAIHELSFDENGFMAKLNHEVEVSSIPAVFRSKSSEDALNKYLLESQLLPNSGKLLKKYVEPRRIGARG